ncbi:MAG: hypothetical protein KF870_13005 [Leadbetterella sp.]|nr:hypothetical protein [Leadbetterella sp.]
MVVFLRSYFFIYVLFVGVFGLLTTRKQPKTYWTTFPWFIIVVGILDGSGLLINRYLLGKYPQLSFFYYQLFVIPFQVIYYFWLINKGIVNSNRFYYTGTVVFILSVIVECFTLIDLEGYYFNSFSYMVANLLMLAHILRYFYQLSKNDRILFFYRERMFWVTLGLLVFWLGALPLFGIFNYMVVNYPKVFTIYFNVILIFNFIMYTCFLISFVWAVREK